MNRRLSEIAGYDRSLAHRSAVGTLGGAISHWLENGSLGQRIRVENAGNRQRFLATVTGPGTAVLEDRPISRSARP